MKKREVHFKECENNPKFLVDVSYAEAKNKYDQTKVKNYPGHEKYGLMKIAEDNFDEIALINVTDTHFFGDGFDNKRCTLAFDWINYTANARVVYGGDVFDIASLTGKTNPHQSVLNNASSIDLAASDNYIGKIASKTFCAIGGNHDAEYANRLRDTGISPLKLTMKHYGIPYFEYSALIRCKVGGHYYNLLFAHTGTGKNLLDGGAKYAQEFAARTGICIDALFLGHHHINAHTVTTYQYKNYDKNGKLLGVVNQKLEIFIDPSFQGTNEHFLSNNIDRPNTNAMATILSERANPYYSEKTKYTEKENLLVIKRFPILNENHDSYTIPALNYMNKMLDKKETLLEEIKEIMKSSKTKVKIEASTKMLSSLIRKNGGNNNARK